MLSPEAAAKLHERDAFIILRGLPQGADVGIDGAAWVVDAGFEGFKMVPQGWHLVTWNAAVQEGTSPSPAGTAGLGGALFRRYDQHQLVLRTYDQASERFLHPDAAPLLMTPAAAEAVSRTPVEAELPAAIASLDHLKSIDRQLAPFPLTRSQAWFTATSALHALPSDEQARVVAAVLGVDPRSGDSWTDPLAELQLVSADGKCEQASSSSRRSRDQTKLQQAEAELEAQLARGRGRQEDEPMPEAAPSTSTQPQFTQESVPPLRFPFFDARVSWPQGAVGPLLTRWSLDKSYALVRLARDTYHFIHPATIVDEVQPSPSQLELGKGYVLALFELSFILFACARNSALFSYWSDLLTLFCQCPTLLGAPDQFSHHPAEANLQASTQPKPEPCEALPLPPDLPLAAQFLRTLRGQLELLHESDLDPEGNTALAGLRTHLTDNLSALRRNVARALATSALHRPCTSSTSSTSPSRPSSDSGAELVAQYRALSHLLQRKFHIDLDTQLDEEVEVGARRPPPAWTQNLRALGLDPAEVQTLELEVDDEDGPAVVSQL